MDVEKTIQFLLENQAAHEARFSREMEEIDARLNRVTQRQERNERLTYQLITLMSQQQSQAGKRILQTEERFRKTDERLDELFRKTDERINNLGKKMDAFLSGLGRGNGHRGKNGGPKKNS